MEKEPKENIFIRFDNVEDLNLFINDGFIERQKIKYYKSFTAPVLILTFNKISYTIIEQKCKEYNGSIFKNTKYSPFSIV